MTIHVNRKIVYKAPYLFNYLFSEHEGSGLLLKICGRLFSAPGVMAINGIEESRHRSTLLTGSRPK